MAGRTDNNGRPLPASYPGAVVTHGLTPEEEHEWRKWTPKVGDVVLVDTFEDGLWPAKVCQKKSLKSGLYAYSPIDYRQENFFPRPYRPQRQSFLPNPHL